MKGRTALAWAVLLAVAILFAWNVRQHYFLGDDCFISFRYSQHLVEGKGLVWNDGERVEGYTNFLWVILMAASLALGLAPEITANVLGIASGFLVLAALARFGARRRSLASPIVWLPLAALASSRSFTAWSTGGLETMFFTLLVLLGFLAFLAERAERARRPWTSSVLFALATLTRPDGAIFMVVAGAAYLLDVVRGTRRLRSALSWALPFVAVVGAHLLWRRGYYGYWLPNTFHAKASEFRWERGLAYVALFSKYYAVAWFLPLALLPLFGRDRYVARLFVAVVAAQVTYVVAIGGDRFEFRFLVVALPFLYWVLSEGIVVLGEWSGPRRPLRVVAVGAAGALLVATHTGSVKIVPVEERGKVAALQLIERYANDRVEQGKYLRQKIEEGILPRDLVVCVGGAGAIPYYTGWTTIDRRGLNDTYVAHLPSPEGKMAGHEHNAPWEYLVERKVVVFDVLNKLVSASPRGVRSGRAREYLDREVEMRAVELDEDHYLVFGTFVSDDELERALPGLEIIRP